MRFKLAKDLLPDKYRRLEIALTIGLSISVVLGVLAWMIYFFGYQMGANKCNAGDENICRVILSPGGQILYESDPKLEEMISEIVRVFKPEGKAVVLKAINIAYCESRWNPSAFNINKNGSTDGGLLQINSVHKLSNSERFDFRLNIKKSHEIYKSWGRSFRAWTCAKKV